MAQDSGRTDNANQEIDIDDLEVDILILAKNPNSLKQTCAFLTRRGWPTRALGNISRIVEEIAEKRPDLVLISFNHPSPAVHKLPDLIAQTFNLITVGFVEGQDAGSASRLNAMKIRHKIFGSPSGPNFHRGIRRILGERYNIKIDDKPGKEEKSSGGSQESARAGRTSNVDDSGIIIQKAAPSIQGKGGHGFSGPKTVEKKATTSTQKEGAALTATESGPEGTQFNVTQEAPDDEVSNGTYTFGSKPRKKLKQLAGMERATDAAGNLLFGENLDPSKTAEAPAATADGAPADLVGMLKKSLFGDQPEGMTADPQETLSKAVEGAISQICSRQSQVEPIPLNKVTRLAVFPVDSENLPGYLVMALEVSEAEDQRNFLKSCEGILRGTFSAMNVPGKLEPGFWIDVPEVSFDPWAENAGAFNFKMNHLGREMGVAYFQTDKPITKPRPSDDNEMFAVGVAEISTQEPTNFKAYLFLKENKKFFLYLRNGRKLQPEQKKRLEEKQVAEIYMKSVDLENFRRFLAMAYLKNSIKGSSDAA